MNYKIKINLKKIKGSFVANIQGKNEQRTCLCIDLKQSDLFAKDDKVWLNVAMFERKEIGKYGDTHSIKQSFSKKRFESMTDEEKDNIPFLGDAEPMESIKVDVTSQAIMPNGNNDELPF